MGANMAEKEPVKKPRYRKSPETIRERAQKESEKKQNPKKGKLKARVHKPLSSLRRASTKRYQPIKAPDNKAGKVLNKEVRFIPKFVRESWAEIKQVSWPSKGEAAQKTAAVFGFAIFFIILVQVLDEIFSRVVKEIILG
jgi:preprotein translocase SecE subunit